MNSTVQNNGEEIPKNRNVFGKIGCVFGVITILGFGLIVFIRVNTGDAPVIIVGTSILTGIIGLVMYIIGKSKK